MKCLAEAEVSGTTRNSARKLLSPLTLEADLPAQRIDICDRCVVPEHMQQVRAASFPHSRLPQFEHEHNARTW